MCATLIKLGDEESFEKTLSLISYSIQNKIELYNKNIITINLKKHPCFIKNIFKGKSNFFNNLILLIKQIHKSEQRQELFSILNYLFLEEYKGLYFRSDNRDKELEQIFIDQQLYFSSMSLEINSYNSYDKPTY